jgi:hypothetical protein
MEAKMTELKQIKLIHTLLQNMEERFLMESFINQNQM